MSEDDYFGDDTGGSLLNHLVVRRNKALAAREKRKEKNQAKTNGANGEHQDADYAKEFTDGVIDRLKMWRECGLAFNDKQVPFCNEHNATQLLTHHPEWRNRIWFDAFYGRIYHLNGAGPEQWQDADDVSATVWVQKECGMPKMGVETVRRAVNFVARANEQNECRNWLESLEHDGTPRIAHFLIDILGAKDDEYTRAASRNFWISLAARALKPGCQVDNMLILEGSQGIGKSSALRLIGGEWYAEAHENLRDKDFFLALQGKLLVEITEMDAFSRADTARVKQVVTCRVDRYRSPYEARAQDHPRFTVFCGTTNDTGYLRDVTGARRFWPVACGQIRLDLLRDTREQLFAEAVAQYQKGESWWNMPEGATQEAQDARQHADPWEDTVVSFVALKSRVSVPDVLGNLGLEVKHFDKPAQMRVADILTAHGWKRERIYENGRRQRVWSKPTDSLI